MFTDVWGLEAEKKEYKEGDRAVNKNGVTVELTREDGELKWAQVSKANGEVIVERNRPIQTSAEKALAKIEYEVAEKNSRIDNLNAYIVNRGYAPVPHIKFEYVLNQRFSLAQYGLETFLDASGYYDDKKSRECFDKGDEFGGYKYGFISAIKKLTIAWMIKDICFPKEGYGSASSEAVETVETQVATNSIKFKTFSSFKNYYGSAGEGYAWHHIVEQNPNNLTKFGAEALHNTNNIIKLPHGKSSIHARVSGYYSSKQPFTGGKTVRQWLNSQSFQQQYDFGIKILNEFGWKP